MTKYIVSILFLLCGLANAQVTLEGFPNMIPAELSSGTFDAKVCNHSGKQITSVKAIVKNYTAENVSLLNWKDLKHDPDTAGLISTQVSQLQDGECMTLTFTPPNPLKGYAVRIMTHYLDSDGQKHVVRFCKLHAQVKTQDYMLDCTRQEQWAEANHKSD